VRWVSRFVTAVLVAALIFGGWWWLRSSMPATEVGQRFKTCATFRDGTRLAVGSPVLIAGIRIGEVTRLTVENNLARVDMRLVDDAKIPFDSWATKRAYSPFGDSYVEILPGGGDAGAAPVRELRPGECIARVIEGTTTDRVLRVFERAMPRVDDGLERLHEVGMLGRKWASGTLEDRVLDAERWLDEANIERPLEKASSAMERLEAATTGAADSVSKGRPDVVKAFDRIERGVSAARKQMAELEVTLRDGLKATREGLDGADPMIDDLRETMIAIDEGRGDGPEGTLGRLVNDPGIADTLEEGTEAAREGVGGFARFKSWLGLRIEFNWFSKQPRFFVTAEVRARTDKFYLVELEKGPLGDFPDDDLSDAVGVPDYTRHQQIRESLRFTVQFGKTFGNWFQVRGGLKESTFGFGADVLVNSGKLRFHGDLYGGFTRTPRLKLASALEVFRSVYLIAGIDDALTPPGYLNIRKGNTDVPIQFDQVRYGRDYFLGASLHFDDADLSLLLRVYGALLIGLL
jgi:phospholipid/cholesterol/gamma-HCH transport system substrate-binding protein